MHSADYAAASRLPVRLSVRPSVCPTHAGILSKRLHSTHILKLLSPSGTDG